MRTHKLVGLFVVVVLLMGAEGDSWWDSFTGWIFNGMKRWFCWLVGWFMDLGDDLLDQVIGWLPSMPADWWSSLVGWLGLLNAYVPIDTFLFCVWAYVSCCASFAAFGWWRRFMPF